MRPRLIIPLTLALVLPAVTACMASPPPQDRGAEGPPQKGRLPEAYAGPLTGKERVAWVQQVGSGTKIAEFIFYIYIDGRKMRLTDAQCELMQGSRHHLCLAPLPEMSPGKHTLQFAAARLVDGKEKASTLSEPLTVTRSLERGS